MGICHDQTVASDLSLAFGGSTAIDGDTFSDCSVVADNRQCVLAAELKILRYGTNDSSGENNTVFSDPGTFKDCDIAAYACALADFHVLVDGHERINHYGGCYFGSGMYIGKWLFHFQSFLITYS